MSQKPGSSLIAPKAGAKAAAAAPAKAAAPIRWFLVASPDKTIRMQGRAEFMIREGKEINSGEYDIALLEARGVKLKPIEPPGWYTEAQAASVRRHAELTEKGIDLPPLPETAKPEREPAQQPS